MQLTGSRKARGKNVMDSKGNFKKMKTTLKKHGYLILFSY